MIDDDFLKVVQIWVSEQETMAPSSCYDAISILYALLVIEGKKVRFAVEQSDLWIDGVENIYALLTLSPLRYFIRELTEHYIDFISRIAVLVVMEADMGHIPEYDEDQVLADYMHTTPKRRLLLNIEHINRGLPGEEALRLWEKTGCPGYEVTITTLVDEPVEEFATTYVS